MIVSGHKDNGMQSTNVQVFDVCMKKDRQGLWVIYGTVAALTIKLSYLTGPRGDSDKWPMNRAVCQWTIFNVQSYGQCPNSRRPLRLSVHDFLKHCFYLIKIVVNIVTAFTFGQFIRRIIYSKCLRLWKMVLTIHW